MTQASPTIEQLQQQIERLETKLAYQDDTIEQLNQEITAINAQQATVNRQLVLLAQKLSENKGSNIASEADEVPPPHY